MKTGLRMLAKLVLSVAAGVLLFLGWTLWGTTARTDEAQEHLERRFEAMPHAPRARSTARGIEPQRRGPPRNYSPAPGSPVFRLEIPSIDLDTIVVEGVREEDLVNGPGHYPECDENFRLPLCSKFDAVYPGEPGRVIVSGHRTTYGAPFWDMDKLRPGDEVITETRWGDFVYEVTHTRILPAAESASVIKRGTKPEIIFTTCNPRFSAAERLIVFARLAERRAVA